MTTIRQLRYVAAVDAERHFSRAAASCHVSQPALSSQVASLERTLGVVLFDRVPYGAVTTPEGAVVIAQARRVLREVDALEHLANDQRSVRGPLHLGVIPTMAPYLLTDVLSVLRDVLPESAPWLHEERTATLINSLHDGTIDVALLALPIGDDSLHTELLGTEPFDLVVPDSHPLATGGDSLPSSILAELPMLLLEDGHCLRDQALEVCSVAGAATVANVRAASLPTLLQMVAAGHGVTLLPRSARDVEIRTGVGVAVREFADPGPGRKVALAWRRNSVRVAAWRRLADALRPLANWGGLGNGIDDGHP